MNITDKDKLKLTAYFNLIRSSYKWNNTNKRESRQGSNEGYYISFGRFKGVLKYYTRDMSVGYGEWLEKYHPSGESCHIRRLPKGILFELFDKSGNSLFYTYL